MSYTAHQTPDSKQVIGTRLNIFIVHVIIATSLHYGNIKTSFESQKGGRANDQSSHTDHRMHTTFRVSYYAGRYPCPPPKKPSKTQQVNPISRAPISGKTCHYQQINSCRSRVLRSAPSSSPFGVRSVPSHYKNRN